VLFIGLGVFAGNTLSAWETKNKNELDGMLAKINRPDTERETMMPKMR
jgi:hypothetical protein